MGPSNETEAEVLERRKVEALERIANVLEAAFNERTGCIDIQVHEVRD